jgi:hypothetical protein
VAAPCAARSAGRNAAEGTSSHYLASPFKELGTDYRLYVPRRTGIGGQVSPGSNTHASRHSRRYHCPGMWHLSPMKRKASHPTNCKDARRINAWDSRDNASKDSVRRKSKKREENERTLTRRCLCRPRRFRRQVLDSERQLGASISSESIDQHFRGTGRRGSVDNVPMVREGQRCVGRAHQSTLIPCNDDAFVVITRGPI